MDNTGFVLLVNSEYYYYLPWPLQDSEHPGKCPLQTVVGRAKMEGSWHVAQPPKPLYELLWPAPSFYHHPLVLNLKFEYTLNSSELPPKSMKFTFRGRYVIGSES